MEIAVDLIKEIFELLSLADGPTGYLMIFTPAWFLVLVLFMIIMRKKDKKIFKILGLIPVIHFAVFYLINFTKGNQSVGLLRYGSHLVAALLFLLTGLWISHGKRKVLPLVITGFLTFVFSSVAILYVFAFEGSYHLGNFTHYGYERSMSLLIDELEKNYVLRDHKEIDFDALRNTYIPMAAEAEKNKDEVAFAEAVTNLCYEFHDGHLSFRVLDDELSSKVMYKMAGNDYGFSMIRQDDGKTVVILLDKKSEAYKLGIRNRSVITEWDGVKIDEAISKVRCVQPMYQICAFPIAENEEIVKPIFLAGKGGDKVKVKFIDESGNEKEVSVSANGSYYDRLKEALYPLSEKWCSEFGFAKMLDDHCGYLCIPQESFDPVNDIGAALADEYPSLKQLIVDRIEGLKAQGMDRLILDLRGNDGGIDVIYEEIVSLFTDKEIVYYGGFYDGKTYRMSDSWAWTIPVDGRYKDIPVVALVNAGCASSGDMFAYSISKCPNVTMMGITTTWGSAQALGGRCYLTDGRITVRYPIIASLDENGSVVMDAGKDRKSSLKLDKRIPLDSTAVYCMYELGGDYDLAYTRKYLNGEI